MFPFKNTKKNYYQLQHTALPKDKKTAASTFFKGKNRQKLIGIIVGTYLVFCLVFAGIMLRFPSAEIARASQPATITSAIRFVEEKPFKIGAKVEVVLTLQNTSITESVNNLNFSLESTKDAVNWQELSLQNSPEGQKIIQSEEEKVFKLPVLSSGERVEYIASGVLKDNQLDFLTVVGKIKYLTLEGVRNEETNRIFVTIGSNRRSVGSAFKLTSNQTQYVPTDTIDLGLAVLNDKIDTKTLKGKIFINPSSEQKSAQTLECPFNESSSCKVSVKNLPSGNYTAIFVDEGETYTSNIVEFFVKGETDNVLTVSNQADLQLPMGKVSINGILPIILDKAISKNEFLDKNKVCLFQIFTAVDKDLLLEEKTEDKKLAPVLELQSSVEDDRRCKVVIDSSKFEKEGDYMLKVAGSNLIESISIYNKNPILIPITNQSGNIQKDLPVRIVAGQQNINVTESTSDENTSEVQSEVQVEQMSTIVEEEAAIPTTTESETKDETTINANTENANTATSSNSIIEPDANLTPEDSQPENQPNTNEGGSDIFVSNEDLIPDGTLATIVLYNQNTGNIQEINNLNNDQLVSKDGMLSAEINPSYFKEAGYYLMYVKFENNQQTDFVELTFGTSEIAFSGSSVLVDKEANLVAGESFSMNLTSLTDKNSNLVSSGQCKANIYGMQNPLDPIELAGEIKDSVCKIDVKKDTLKKSGPFFVTFSENDTKINQSKQFYLKANSATSYGNINFEYEPVRKSYANNLIIGPVVDRFNNLANGIDYKLVLKTEGVEDKIIDKLEIENGFVNVLLPSSYTNQDKIEFVLQDKVGLDVMTRTVDLVQSDDKLILPVFPKDLQSQENLKVGLKDWPVDLENCQLKFIKNQDSILEESVIYDKDKKTCEFDWAITKFRDQNRVLLTFEVAGNTFNRILDLKATEANNIFTISPSLRLTSKDDIEINLLTSPLIDKYGLYVGESKMQWQYNGKVLQTNIKQGFSSLNLLASNLESKDVRNNISGRVLDLDLDVKAGVSSISRVNNLIIYLGNKDISNQNTYFEIKNASNFVTANQSTVFNFKSEYCELKLQNASGVIGSITTHLQGDNCLVEAPKQAGKYNLVFENQGFVLGIFEFTVTNDQQGISWCTPGLTNCTIEILAPTNSTIQATIYDGEKEYVFDSKDLQNGLLIQQNGLNPLKKYPIKITYKDIQDNNVVYYNQILGEKFSKKE